AGDDVAALVSRRLHGQLDTVVLVGDVGGPQGARGLDGNLAAGEEAGLSARARAQFRFGQGLQVAARLGEVDGALDGRGDAEEGAQSAGRQRQVDAGRRRGRGVGGTEVAGEA